MATLAPEWRERFKRDVERDSAFERSLLVRQWLMMLAIFLLVLLKRLFL